jgi:hypothetical protein
MRRVFGAMRASRDAQGHREPHLSMLAANRLEVDFGRSLHVIATL